MLGGMRMPSVPPIAIEPVGEPVRVLVLRISGSAIVPIVAQVAAHEPQIAPNPAQAAIVPQARLPGRRDSHLFPGVVQCARQAGVIGEVAITMKRGYDEGIRAGLRRGERSQQADRRGGIHDERISDKPDQKAAPGRCSYPGISAQERRRCRVCRSLEVYIANSVSFRFYRLT